MGEKYVIKNISDILQLTPDQRARCIVDLQVWMEFSDFLKDEGAGFHAQDFFVWVDDDRTGEISGIKVGDILVAT